MFTILCYDSILDLHDEEVIRNGFDPFEGFTYDDEEEAFWAFQTLKIESGWQNIRVYRNGKLMR